MFLLLVLSLQTPLEYLEPILREDIQKVNLFVFGYICICSSLVLYCIIQHFDRCLFLQIWDAVPKPQTLKNTPLSEFFNVRVFYFIFSRFSFCHWFIFYRHFSFCLIKVYWHFLLLTWRWRLLLCLAMKKKKSNLKSR